MISLSCFTSFFFFFSWSAECDISTDNKRCSLSAPRTSGVPCQPSSIPAPFPACSPLTWGAIIANRLRARSEQQDSLSLSSNWLPAKPSSLALPSHLSPQFRPVHSCPFSWCWLLYWPPTSFKMIQCTKQTDVKSGGQNKSKNARRGEEAMVRYWLSSSNSQRSCFIQKEQALSGLHLTHLRQLRQSRDHVHRIYYPLAFTPFSFTMLYN